LLSKPLFTVAYHFKRAIFKELFDLKSMQKQFLRLISKVEIVKFGNLGIGDLMYSNKIL
jgi:hypothetical protein